MGLEELNNHVKKFGPLENPHFGEQPAFFIDEGRFIPYRAISYGNALVAYEIGRQLGNWTKCSGEGGRVTSPQGAFIFNTDVDIRMPDVAYTPRDADGEVDKLSGWGSKRSDLDRKMRNEYFQNVLGQLFVERPRWWRCPSRIQDHKLDRVLNQDSRSSSEEEVDLTCPLRECGQQFTAVGRLNGHMEWHRGERADQKYLAKQKYLGV